SPPTLILLLPAHSLHHSTRPQVEFRAFHVPRNLAVELPFELRLDRRRESVVCEIPFPKHLEDRPLHRLILCPDDVDTSLSLRVSCQALLFHGATGEDESYLDKSSCASGGRTLNTPFRGLSTVLAVRS